VGRVIVVRHHDVDSAGFIGAAFEARGAELDLADTRPWTTSVGWLVPYPRRRLMCVHDY
jgi:hypothetical protein